MTLSDKELDAITRLRIAAGALTPREQNMQREATLFSALMNRRIWVHLPKEAQIDAAFDVNLYVRFNALSETFDLLAKDLSKSTMPTEVILIKYFLALQKDGKEIKANIEKLRDKMLEILDRNICISPEDL